jgi:hypothetical protein
VRSWVFAKQPCSCLVLSCYLQLCWNQRVVMHERTRPYLLSLCRHSMGFSCYPPVVSEREASAHALGGIEKSIMTFSNNSTIPLHIFANRSVASRVLVAALGLGLTSYMSNLPFCFQSAKSTRLASSGVVFVPALASCHTQSKRRLSR